jgi:hypothetical protein
MMWSSRFPCLINSTMGPDIAQYPNFLRVLCTHAESRRRSSLHKNDLIVCLSAR